MGECGGLIFNRHKWRYWGDEHRICGKCGKCQYRYNGWWTSTSFDRLMDLMEHARKYRECEQHRRADEKRKALDFLKEA